MPLFASFTGGSNAERSLSADAEKSINLMRSTIESQGSAKQALLVGTPGLTPLASVFTVDGHGAGRGIHTQDDVNWMVAGTILYRFTVQPFAATAIGFVPDDGLPVSFASSGDVGDQLAVVAGGQLFVVNLLTNVMVGPIALPLTNAATQIGYLDTNFILFEADSLRFWFSDDATVWDALDFATRSRTTDRIVGGCVANERIWVFGSDTSEAFEDVGDALTPFQSIRGSVFQIGLASRWSLSVGINTLRWLGRSARGGPAVYRLDGYGGTRISTHAIEAALGGYPSVNDAEALTYEQDGHLFYCLTCPRGGDAGVTWVFDEMETSWHQRSHWNAALAREEAWRPRGHAYLSAQHIVGALHVVGSRDSSELWTLDLDTYADAGGILRAVRRCPYLSAERTEVFLDRVELGCEVGVGLNAGQGSDPQVQLNVSKDSGKTWFSAGTSSLGMMGNYEPCVYWTRLGRARLDRLCLEIVITDPVKRAFGPGLYITATPAKAVAA